MRRSFPTIALLLTASCANPKTSTLREAQGPNTTTSNPKETTMLNTTAATTNTVKMQLDVKGTGSPLVLVGGGLTGAESWAPIQLRLAPKHTTARAQPLAVQYGLEEKKLPEDYSVKTESRALGAAIDVQFPSGPIDLVAWSFGAAITLDFALDHPERVRTLTLIEPPAIWVLQASGLGDAESTRESDEMRALYASMKGSVTEDQLESFARQAGLIPPGKSRKDLPQWPNWVKHRRSLLTGDALWKHTDTASRLRSFQKPVLLVKGTGSTHFLHRILEGLAATLPNAQKIELPGGHAPQLVSTDAFLEKLAAFQGAA